MADGVEVNLTGMENLLSKMAAVKKVTRNKAGRAALRKASVVLRDRARKNAKQLDDSTTAEAIHKNITVNWSSKTFRRTGNLAFRVGVMGGARQYANTRSNVRRGRAGRRHPTQGDRRNPGGDTWYWRFLEFGTQHVAAKPFLRPILSGADTEVIDVFAKEFEKAIDRAVARAASRGEEA